MNSQIYDQQDESHEDLDLRVLAEQISQADEKTSPRGQPELTKTSDFMEHLEKEYPRHAQTVHNLNRRDFLKLLSASLALTGLSACVPQPTEKIVPYVNAPQEITQIG